MSYSAELRKFVCTQASEPLIEDISKLLLEQRHAESQWWQERRNLVAARVTDEKLAEFDEKVYQKQLKLAERHRAKLLDLDIPLCSQTAPRSDQQKFLAFLSDLCR